MKFQLVNLIILSIVALLLLGSPIVALAQDPPLPEESQEFNLQEWLVYSGQVGRDIDTLLIALIVAPSALLVTTLVEGWKKLLNESGVTKDAFGTWYQLAIFLAGAVISAAIVFGQNANLFEPYEASYPYLQDLGPIGQLLLSTVLVWVFAIFGAETIGALRRVAQKFSAITVSTGEILSDGRPTGPAFKANVERLEQDPNRLEHNAKASEYHK